MGSFMVFQLAIVLIFSIVIHEVAHGYMAESLGDPTARRAGRLTLNPIPHLDPLGSVIIPALLIISGTSFVFGWAKPVPYNPSLLTKDMKYGPLKVALAGPATNILLAVVFGIIIRFAYPILSEFTILTLAFAVLINILLAVFNMVPIPPLDGSKILTILLPYPYSMMVQQIGLVGIFLVLFFLFFLEGFTIISVVTFSIFEFIIGADAWKVVTDIVGPYFSG